ncbi:MAG: radical SAM protein [Candidatus Omnitrophica bacterium]|nr:radical SAM protein [Candidatus Omnitrophota bacterium]
MIGAYPQLLISDKKGKVSELFDIEACGMKAGVFFRLTAKDWIRLPFGSRLFMLPQRLAVGYAREERGFITIASNPFSKTNKRCFAVSAFLPPGYTLTYNSAYRQIGNPKPLPLFAYAPVAFYKGNFFTTAVRVDRERRQDERLMKTSKLKKNIQKLTKLFSGNRLVKHLENCALTYNCPAAKNFFLIRYEAPLPSSQTCNSQCFGCISLQINKACPVTQPRIKFLPTPEEIAEIATFHIKNVRDPVVSFGQGCEGEPLCVADTIESAIRLIRKKTTKGIINLNTNASKPRKIASLFDVGLDSIRVSINSVQEEYYKRYYKPRGYEFKDVKHSLRIAKRMKGFVSLNYLTIPGFTDSEKESSAFKCFLNTYKIDMIQWRNLNIDPYAYLREIGFCPDGFKMTGIKELIDSILINFPDIMVGYFNPSKERISRRGRAG